MNIIKELKKEAHHAESDGLPQWIVDFLNQCADHLSKLNCLVPVVDESEDEKDLECPWAHSYVYAAKRMMFCKIDGQFYLAGSPESIKINISTGEISRMYGEDYFIPAELIDLNEMK